MMMPAVALGLVQSAIVQVRAGYRPPPEVTVSEFADAHIIVTSGPLAGTRWQTAFAPYQRGIMDAFREPGVEIVVVMGSSQFGKTSIALNVVAYHMAHDPCAVLVVEPTVDPMAKDFAKNRLEPVIAATPILRDTVSKKRAKDASNTVLSKTFKGGAVSIGGANSAASLAARSVRLLVLDEIDRYPPELAGEGSTIAVAMKRTQAYQRRRRILMLSSPTLEGAPIHAWFQRGDQRRYYVPCPACDCMHPFEWQQVRWTNDDPATARVHCPACDHGITDAERVAILSGGEWRPEKPERRTKSIVSFSMWECYALAIDTQIPTPTGWSTMEALRPGDEVFDERGEICRVTHVTGVMHDRRCYRVSFSDGCSIVADATHLWPVEYNSSDGRGTIVSQVLTTEQVAADAIYPCGALRYAIPVAAPLALPDVALPVDPYILGAWLGDGDGRGARIFAGAKDADEMANHLRACGPAVLIRPTKTGVCILQIEPENKLAGRYGSGGSPGPGSDPRSVFAGLRALGLLFNGQSRKAVPPPYLRASRSQRLALLQGLMDTDGCIGAANAVCSYSTTSPEIAAGVMDLVAGLGLKCRRYERTRGANKTEVRLNFQAPSTLPVFRLARKRARQNECAYRESKLVRRKIVSVQAVESVPVKCITVDSASRLYLAGDAMIPTHNSPLSSLSEMVAGFLAAREKQKAGDKAEMHTWQNTTLGEPVAPDAGDGVEPSSLLLRREAYPPDVDVPAGACCLTMGVDVQDDRLEALVIGWGPGEESWLVDRQTLPGDTSQPEPWRALDALLDVSYQHATGQSLMIHATCIDSAGHRTTMVYDYAERQAARRVYAIIGRDGQRPIVSSPSPKRWGRHERQVPLYTIGVDAAKSLIVSRLKLTEKGPGYVHLPHQDWADEELAAQLASERLVTKWSKGIPVQIWRKVRARNEALDMAVYGLAALRLLNPRLGAMLQSLQLNAGREPSGTPPTGGAPGAAPAPRPTRRLARSGYLGR